MLALLFSIQEYLQAISITCGLGAIYYVVQYTRYQGNGKGNGRAAGFIVAGIGGIIAAILYARLRMGSVPSILVTTAVHCGLQVLFVGTIRAYRECLRVEGKPLWEQRIVARLQTWLRKGKD